MINYIIHCRGKFIIHLKSVHFVIANELVTCHISHTRNFLRGIA